MKLLFDYTKKPEGDYLNASNVYRPDENLNQFMFVVDGQECVNLNENERKLVMDKKEDVTFRETVLKPFY